MPVTPNSAAILRARNFPENSHFFYELAYPAAADMGANVVYAGVANFSRNMLADSAISMAMGFFDPPKARWLGGLAYHSILPEQPIANPAERPDSYIIPLRNELAAKYVGSRLAKFVANYVHRPKATGVEPGWTLGKVYEKLGERSTNPWTAEHREYLAVMLNEPGFNALLITNLLGDKFSEDDCLDDDPTTISMTKFIDGLNGNPRDSRDIFWPIYAHRYAPTKSQFVSQLLTWANGGDPSIFGSFGDAYERYQPSPSA
jgi:hypothetical protein